MGSGMFQGSATSPTQGAGPIVPYLLGTPYVHPYGLTCSDEIWYGNTWEWHVSRRSAGPKIL